jgi:hypothetical protein
MSEQLVGRTSAFGRAKRSRSIDPQDRQHHRRHDRSQGSKNQEHHMNHIDGEETEAHRVKDESKSTSQLPNSDPAWNQHSPAVGNRS